MLRNGMVGGAAISGVIQKLFVGRHAVIHGACDRIYVDKAPEMTCGAGRLKKTGAGLHGSECDVVSALPAVLEDHGGVGSGVMA